MKAVLIDRPTKANEIVLSECDIPDVKEGWVLVKVKAFGLNHSEQILRQEEILEDYIKKPVIPGIECVGEIEDPSDSHFHKGQKVVALMGGMGRIFDGSYAEYALLPTNHVFSIDSALPWENTPRENIPWENFSRENTSRKNIPKENIPQENIPQEKFPQENIPQENIPWEKLAVIPETYFTAWGSLFECLRLKPEDTLLIRGATCALGYAAIRLAKALGCRVIATTHRESKLSLLENADESVFDDGILAGKLKGTGITKALELVGPKTVRDTLKCMEQGGIVCNTGILGGVYTLDQFDPIKEIPNGVYLTGFFSDYPSQEVITDIFRFITEKGIDPQYGACFDFEEIGAALEAMDSGKVNGKIVVRMP